MATEKAETDRVPITLALSTITPQDRAEASGGFNLARTVGGIARSLGAALIHAPNAERSPRASAGPAKVLIKI